MLGITVRSLPWYSRIPASCCMVKLGRAEPMAWNAALLGAKMVRSLASSMASTKFACIRAPAVSLRPASTAVMEALAGRVRTWLMIWTTPPVKFIS